jgi:hypothetical protein
MGWTRDALHAGANPARSPAAVSVAVAARTVHTSVLFTPKSIDDTRREASEETHRPASFGRGGDQPDVADTKTEQSAESEGLVSGVLESGIGVRIVRMV